MSATLPTVRRQADDGGDLGKDGANWLRDTLAFLGDCELAIAGTIASAISTYSAYVAATFLVASGGTGFAISGLGWAAPTAVGVILSAESHNRSTTANDSTGMKIGKFNFSSASFPSLSVVGGGASLVYECIIRPARDGTVIERASGFVQTNWDRTTSGVEWGIDQFTSLFGR